MAEYTFTLFRQYEFTVGQKIRIEGGRRSGDWEVTGSSDRKVRLRCPISGQEVEWDRFCYLLEDRKGTWPDRG